MITKRDVNQKIKRFSYSVRVYVGLTFQISLPFHVQQLGKPLLFYIPEP